MDCGKDIFLLHLHCLKINGTKRMKTEEFKGSMWFFVTKACRWRRTEKLENNYDKTKYQKKIREIYGLMLSGKQIQWSKKYILSWCSRLIVTDIGNQIPPKRRNILFIALHLLLVFSQLHFKVLLFVFKTAHFLNVLRIMPDASQHTVNQLDFAVSCMAHVNLFRVFGR